MAKKTRTKKRVKKNIANGVVHIQSTFNNTIVTITDSIGNVVSWSSAGVQGFKGSRKSTPFAAQLASEDAAKKAMEHGMRSVEVYVKGPGPGRESALRALHAAGLNLVTIKDVTYAQVLEVFSRQKIYNRIELAKDYSDFNSLTPSRPLLDSFANLPSIVPIKPELTSNSVERDSSGNLVDQEKIKLVITITPL